MSVDLFAGVPVADRATSIDWYSRLLGSEPAFLPNDNEAVWQLGEHAYLYVDVRPAHAGHALHTVFVDDLDARVTATAARGIEPTSSETYDNGVTKVTFHDPDGNEIGWAGGPAA